MTTIQNINLGAAPNDNTGDTIRTGGQKINSNFTNLNSDKLETSLKGAINGLAELDSTGKVPASQLTISAMEYKGTWNASTNTPALADGVGNTGDVYNVSVAGTQNLGSGNITFEIGDWAIYNGAIWEKSTNTNYVTSVFTRIGDVTAQTGDYTASQVTNTPAGNIAAVTVQAAINELDNDKVAANVAITPATNTKITYDSKGLVTSGVAATTADINDSIDRRYVTDAESTVIDNTSGINTGDQTITLTGDVTGSGTGSFPATIANDSVTFAKMQNAIANSKLIGSGATGAGADYVELTVGTNLTMTGTTLSADVQAGTTNLAYTASATDGTVTSDTGTDATLPLATPTAGTNLAGLLSPGDKTKLDATSGTNTGDQTITLTGDVTGSGTGSFAATIANNAVTNAKAAQMPANTIKGNNTGGAANALDLTVIQVETMLTNTAKLNVPQEFTAQQNFDATTLVDASSISWDLNTNQVATVILAGNRELATPTNMKDGGTYILRVKQDAIGSRTLGYSPSYKFPGGISPTLSTNPNTTDILTFISDGVSMYGVAQTNFDAPFEPSQVSGLSWWLDADDASTIVESGGIVSQWNDKSGNNNNATSGTGSPTTNIRTINGRNALDFDGVNDQMLFSYNDFANTNFTFFMVEKRDDLSVARSPIASNSTSSGNQLEAFYFTNGNLNFGNGVNGIISVNVGLDTTNTRIIGWNHDSTLGKKLFLNGTQIGSNANTTNITTPTPQGQLGSRVNGVYYDGAMCEVLMFNKTLNATEFADITQYLKDKWGV